MRNGRKILFCFITGLAASVLGLLFWGRCPVAGWSFLIAAPWLMFAWILFLHRDTSSECVVGLAAADSLSEAYRRATVALASAIGAKDSYIHPCVNRVPRICELIADHIDLDHDAVEKLKLAALIRDVGKLGVPDHILLKPGPLDAEEFAKMRNHAAIGADLLRQADLPDDVVDMVLYHHEKYDGTGYPERLAANDIPLGSRIISVAVVYDALISDRCYRSGWTHSDAISHIQELSGAAFDPAVVDAFFAVESQILELGAELARDMKSQVNGSAEVSCAAVDTIAQANRELISLFEITQTLSSTLEIDEVLALLANRTRRLVQGSTCVVLMVDKTHSKSLIAKTAVGRFEEMFVGARARYGKGITGRAAQKAQPRAGHYDPDDLVFNYSETPPELDFKSCLAVPIVSYGDVLGTINLYDVCRRSFTEDEMRVLTFIAHQAALAVHNARAFEEARDFALRDPLTNLRNGRFLRHYLDRELNRSFRFDEPLSVLGIDLDNFKGVNDLKGHEAGDRVLKDVADIFRRELRDYDVIVRNGGDEFVAVLPETGSSEAKRTAQRIQSAIENYAHTKVNDVPRFGVSVGVASYPADGTDASALLASADAAMYADKRSRNLFREAA